MADYEGLPVGVDVMGGDKAGDGVAVMGALAAQSEFGIPVTLIGHRDFISQFTTDSSVSIVHAEAAVKMKAKERRELRLKDSSILVGFGLINSGEISSLVSAGNSGAMYVNAGLELGHIDRTIKPAIAALLPRPAGEGMTVLMDSGATMECDAKDLVFHAVMGAVMASGRFGIEKPTVALQSNGEEAEKGMPVTVETNAILKYLEDDGQLEAFRFVGNIEGRDIMTSAADVVVVPNGYVGNTILKTLEGASKQLILALMSEFDDFDPVIKNEIMSRLFIFGMRLHPRTYGGAVLLGVDKGYPIISHGSSDEVAIKNSVKVGADAAQSGLIDSIKTAFAEFPIRTANGK